MIALHHECDCFVLPHRAEGWGIPQFEAMAAGNLCIATRYSGNLEFMNDNNSLLINCHETPCFRMDRPTYNGKMRWAEPHIDDLAAKMRQAFEDKVELFERPESVLDRFSWDQVGKLMARELGL
jgi:glycosyltransferase involved in cell wall biosynthesis